MVIEINLPHRRKIKGYLNQYMKGSSYCFSINIPYALMLKNQASDYSYTV